LKKLLLLSGITSLKMNTLHLTESMKASPYRMEFESLISGDSLNPEPSDSLSSRTFIQNVGKEPVQTQLAQL